ncbi:uncharacterized protein MELLADRAFT_109329 [Melampsora larici-populina 98AG31]|uniref:Secreted protein n=1 Tax=Melampsora larici-populina (strain 98AG31 / pathotype 3-4-7) TaxID=747676 RepID=F4RW39_MELLP|nr:uncharacterized protein MELLADRAFT_109329 [Melampsora larici-populina 98AG31]EGG03467.1 hypothetical protein MELLADRAFT_109329 [Melampsora larici-populina 98AG31]
MILIVTNACLTLAVCHHSAVPTSDPPTLIYSGTQNATLEHLELINAARGHPAEAANGQSSFARRYHATTGPNAKLDAVQAEGYIPLETDSSVVAAEEKRQRDAGMPPCDCSNCEPEEAEALWLAQPALTNENFDAALEMDTSELRDLLKTLPKTPAGLVADLRHIAMPCDQVPSSVPSRTGRLFRPGSGLGLGENVDLLRQPEDLGLILASESIEGQFDLLFKEILLWQDDSAAAEAIAQAASKRAAASRAPPKAIQSVEGAQLSKIRAEACRVASKEARLVEKYLATQAKASEKAAALAKKNQDKLEADQQRAALKEALSIEHANQRALAKSQRAAESAAKRLASGMGKHCPQATTPAAEAGVTPPKRIGEMMAEPSCAKRRATQQSLTPHEGSPTPKGVSEVRSQLGIPQTGCPRMTTHQQPPTGTSIYDPRLGPRE